MTTPALASQRPRRAAGPRAAKTTDLERPLPQNLDAERSVLGAILLDNHSLNAAIEKLKSEDFFLDQHRRIFAQMIEMGKAQQGIDVVTLSDQLHRRGELEAAGGAAYLAQLTDGVPRVIHLEQYAQIVKGKSLLRKLIHGAHSIQQTALEAEEDADVIVARARASMDEICTRSGEKAVRAYSPADLTQMVGEEAIEFIAFPIAVRGMVVLLDGAAKSAGKTTLLLAGVAAVVQDLTFLNRATKQVNVLYITEENPRSFLLALGRAGLNAEKSMVHVVPFGCFAGLAWSALAYRIEAMCVELRIGWLIVDTFYAVAGLGGEEENKAGAVDEAVAPLRALAGKIDLAITLTRHERKSGGDVGVSGRGSSALTGAADVIVLLRRVAGNSSLQRRQLDVTGRIDQGRYEIELTDGRYMIVEPEADVNEAAVLDLAIMANSTASVRELERRTGIGRNRIVKVAAKAEWVLGDSGWVKGGA